MLSSKAGAYGACVWTAKSKRDGASEASNKREDKAACIIHTHAPSPKLIIEEWYSKYKYNFCDV